MLVAGYYVFMLAVCVSVRPSKPVGTYWVDTSWVLAIYAVGVQKKIPNKFEGFVGYL